MIALVFAFAETIKGPRRHTDTRINYKKLLESYLQADFRVELPLYTNQFNFYMYSILCFSKENLKHLFYFFLNIFDNK